MRKQTQNWTNPEIIKMTFKNGAIYITVKTDLPMV